MQRNTQSGSQLNDEIVQIPRPAAFTLTKEQYAQLLANSAPETVEKRGCLLRFMRFLRDHNRKPGVLDVPEMVEVIRDFLKVEDKYQ